MTPEFATPCPHWIDPTDERVLEAMRLTFGKVLVEHEDSDHDPITAFFLYYWLQWFITVIGCCRFAPTLPTLSIKYLF